MKSHDKFFELDAELKEIWQLDSMGERRVPVMEALARLNSFEPDSRRLVAAKTIPIVDKGIIDFSFGYRAALAVSVVAAIILILLPSRFEDNDARIARVANVEDSFEPLLGGDILGDPSNSEIFDQTLLNMERAVWEI